MLRNPLICAIGLVCLALRPALAQTAPAAPPAPAAAPVQYDAELAKSLGGNDQGMRGYVLVILKTGPKKMADGPERKKMFEGHFANMTRLANEKKLAVAGPLDGVDGWRGVFVIATPDIALAKTYVETDPVVVNGEMVAEYHKFYSSAALMAVNGVHEKIQKK
ncbi:YciI family protein [Massilia glaciei]|uniref:YCII-related domain-containing protein n=1 Tax=Massilia glaciei TaxID=1524097 RepID=A0A2U2I5N8_9BURK|nr:YciI family protein [Massilia glaciei]PWF55078.1 hypothetical protein C7C56_003705 [Massilia glaciei]